MPPRGFLGKCSPPFPRKRPAVYTESEDLIHWTHGEQVIPPDTEDPFQMQFYSLTPFHYEGIWLAGLLRMHTVPDVLDPELAWSYDGRAWHRSRARAPFIPRGGEGRFDSVWLNLPTNPPIVNYHQLWFYYSGRAGGPGAQFPAHGRLPFRRPQPDHPQHVHLRGTALLVDARPRQAVRASGHLAGGPFRPPVGGQAHPPVLQDPGRPPLLVPGKQLLSRPNPKVVPAVQAVQD